MRHVITVFKGSEVQNFYYLYFQMDKNMKSSIVKKMLRMMIQTLFNHQRFVKQSR